MRRCPHERDVEFSGCGIAPHAGQDLADSTSGDQVMADEAIDVIDDAGGHHGSSAAHTLLGGLEDQFDRAG